MKRPFLLLLLASLALLAQTDLPLAKWKAWRNIEATQEDGILQCKITARDPQLLLDGLSIEPETCNTLIYKYRATGTQNLPGQLYFANDAGGFSQTNMWRLPVPVSDGRWHTVTLKGNALADGETWFRNGKIKSLRFDPTDSSIGNYELEFIRFEYRKNSNVPLVKLPPLPKVKPIVDATPWEPVTPYFHYSGPPKPLERGAYFAGKMISSPEDRRGQGPYTSFFMRREITLKAAPKDAWLQFTADDACQAFVNGSQVASHDNWRQSKCVNVTTPLKGGKNAFGFIYSNTDNIGGLIAELFVRYADGTFERFDTDGNFKTSPTAADGWCLSGYDAKGWTDVLQRPGPPNAPWTVVLPYRDFDMLQLVKSAEISKSVVEAGEILHVRATFEGKMPKLPFKAKSFLCKDGTNILWDEIVTFDNTNTRKIEGNLWQLSMDCQIPLYASSNKCKLLFQSPNLTTLDGDTLSFDLEIRQRKSIPGFEKKPSFKVTMDAGYPAFSYNGKPFFTVWSGVQRSRRSDDLPSHGDGPIDLVTVYVNEREVWPALDTFHFEQYDRQAEAYRRCNPNALFVFNIMCYPPMEWLQKYPDEACIDGYGNVNKDGRCNHSFASKQALKDLDDFLRKALTYLENSPYANRIVGYRICGGHTLEWLGWDPIPSTTVDFSPAAQKAFTEYARKHYPQLKDTTIPTLDERSDLDGENIIWNPSEHLKSIAYNDFYSDAVADMMIALCKTAKSIAGPDKIVGTYYGYTMTLHGSGCAQMRAHYALRKVLDSKAFDFLISPHPYGLRNIGDIMGDMKPFSTMAKNGIMPVIEEDSRTYSGAPGLGYFQTVNLQATQDVVRRNIGFTLCRNTQLYTYNLSAGTEFDFPEMVPDYQAVVTLGRHCLAKRVQRNAEIALVASEENIKTAPYLQKYVGSGEIRQQYDCNGKVSQVERSGAVLYGDIFSENYVRFARAGAPVDYLLAEDLAENPGDYKLYVFLNCFNFDGKFLRTIQKLRSRNCTLLWIYAPGYSKDGIASTAAMKELTGFNFEMQKIPMVPAAKFADGRIMGTRSTRVMPLFKLLNKEAESIAKYDDGTTAIASMKTGSATSIFTGVWQFDVPFLQDVLKRAGVFAFSSTSDPVEANDALIVHHARFAGHKEIALPRKCDVIDVFERKAVATNAMHFSFDSAVNSTHLFYYGEDALQLLEKLKSESIK